MLDEYVPPAIQMVSPPFTLPQAMPPESQALFQSVPFREPAPPGRTYLLVAMAWLAEITSPKSRTGRAFIGRSKQMDADRAFFTVIFPAEDVPAGHNASGACSPLR